MLIGDASSRRSTRRRPSIFELRPMILDDLGLVPTLRRARPRPRPAGQGIARRLSTPWAPDRRLPVELRERALPDPRRGAGRRPGPGADRVALQSRLVGRMRGRRPRDEPSGRRPPRRRGTAPAGEPNAVGSCRRALAAMMARPARCPAAAPPAEAARSAPRSSLSRRRCAPSRLSNLGRRRCGRDGVELLGYGVGTLRVELPAAGARSGDRPASSRLTAWPRTARR